MSWQIQEAKARCGELVERALRERPQTVTWRGKAVTVLVPAAEYRRLCAGDKRLKALLAARAALTGLSDGSKKCCGRLRTVYFRWTRGLRRPGASDCSRQLSGG
jgi:antitoxin Phd